MPIAYSRLTKISISKSLLPRIAEENRLEKLNIKTKSDYNFLMP